jgi:hypothetical protein
MLRKKHAAPWSSLGDIEMTDLGTGLGYSAALEKTPSVLSTSISIGGSWGLFLNILNRRYPARFYFLHEHSLQQLIYLVAPL